MCRNIRPLFHFEPPTTEDEVRAAALQYVRKVSGMNAPSAANSEAFGAAVDAVAEATRALLGQLAPPRGPARTREAERAKAKARGQARDARVRAKEA
jgi:hypothetical protein